MDESEQQLLHEFNHATAREVPIEMASESHAVVDLREDHDSNRASERTPSPHDLGFPHNSPMEALHASLISGRFSDLMVKHGNSRWQAHQVVVCSQSAVLESMIETMNGAQVINLTEHDHQAVSLMIEYFYASTYTTLDEEPDFSLHTHVKVFVLAVHMGVRGLEALASTKYKQALNNHVSDLEVYFSSVRRIYSSTTPAHPGLRNAVVHAAIMEMRKILSEVPIRNRFQEVTAAVPEYEADILGMLVDAITRPAEVVVQELCEDCGPRGEGEHYSICMACRSCGKERVMEFY